MDEAVISEFLRRFNLMCKNSRRDFLIRERRVFYEAGSRMQRFQVTYKMKLKKHRCEIYAESRVFRIFKKKFPLITLEEKGGLIYLTGMFTGSLASPFDASRLPEKLNQYLEICETVPRDAFVNF